MNDEQVQLMLHIILRQQDTLMRSMSMIEYLLHESDQGPEDDGPPGQDHERGASLQERARVHPQKAEFLKEMYQ